MARLGDFGEQILERRAQGGFVADAVFVVVIEGLVIGLDGLVVGFNMSRERHRWQYLLSTRGVFGSRQFYVGPCVAPNIFMWPSRWIIRRRYVPASEDTAEPGAL